MIGLEQVLLYYKLDSHYPRLWQNGFDSTESFSHISYEELLEMGIEEEESKKLYRLAQIIEINPELLMKNIKDDDDYYRIQIYLSDSRDKFIDVSSQVSEDKRKHPWRRYYSSSIQSSSGLRIPSCCPVCLKDEPGYHVRRYITWSETKRSWGAIYKTRETKRSRIELQIPCCSNHKRSLNKYLSFYMGNCDGITIFVKGSRYAKLLSAANNNALYVSSSRQEKNRPKVVGIVTQISLWLYLGIIVGLFVFLFTR